MGCPAASTTDPQNIDAVPEMVFAVACMDPELPSRQAGGTGLLKDMKSPVELNLEDAIDFFRDVDYKYRALLGDRALA